MPSRARAIGAAAAAAQQDTPSIEQADGASETGLQFALRTGFMLPYGMAGLSGR